MPPYSTAQQTLIAKAARATRCTAAASAAKLKKKFAVHGMALVAATRAVQRQRARARACSAENAQQRPDLSQIYGSRQRSQPEYTPLTAVPHGVGCEVTRGDPRGGGGALSRQRAGGLPYSLVFEVHPCPAHHLPGSSTRSMTSSSPPPRPAPLQARLWPPNSRSSLRERAAARRSSRASRGGGSAPTMSAFGLEGAAAVEKEPAAPAEVRGWWRRRQRYR